jgi:hypothetical protein
MPSISGSNQNTVFKQLEVSGSTPFLQSQIIEPPKPEYHRVTQNQFFAKMIENGRKTKICADVHIVDKMYKVTIFNIFLYQKKKSRYSFMLHKCC